MAFNHAKLNGTMLAVGAASVAGLPTAASAENTPAVVKPLTFSFEGGISRGDFTEQGFGEEKFGDFDEDKGYYGSLSVSRGISRDWDWRLSLSHLEFDPNEESEVRSSGGFTERESFGSQFRSTSVDFDLGKNIALNGGATHLRFGTGLAYSEASNALDISAERSKGLDMEGVDIDADVTFRGVGARMSADVSHKLGGDSSGFRIIGGAELVPMYGEYTLEKGFRAYDTSEGDDFSDSFRDSDDGRLLRTSAYVGLAYDANPRTSVKGGVRATTFTEMGGGNNFLEDTATSYTAFIGMDVRF